jgi:cell wall-associated NlpC family hydrolase
MRILILSLLLCGSAVMAEPVPTPTATPDAPSASTSAPAPGLVDRVGERLVSSLTQVRTSLGDTASGLVENAMGFLGVPYRRGGNSAETGFDCSGFVRKVYEQTVGLVLPHRASEQAQVTQVIDREELQPGDLVFFNTMRRAFSHVGIYLGEGKFIHAPRSGAKVRVGDMREAYWRTRFNGARRVISTLRDGESSQ